MPGATSLRKKKKCLSWQSHIQLSRCSKCCQLPHQAYVFSFLPWHESSACLPSPYCSPNQQGQWGWEDDWTLEWSPRRSPSLCWVSSSFLQPITIPKSYKSWSIRNQNQFAWHPQFTRMKSDVGICSWHYKSGHPPKLPMPESPHSAFPSPLT